MHISHQFIKENKLQMSNYRTIKVTQIFAKFFETPFIEVMGYIDGIMN